MYFLSTINHFVNKNNFNLVGDISRSKSQNTDVSIKSTQFVSLHNSPSSQNYNQALPNTSRYFEQIDHRNCKIQGNQNYTH